MALLHPVSNTDNIPLLSSRYANIVSFVTGVALKHRLIIVIIDVLRPRASSTTATREERPRMFSRMVSDAYSNLINWQG